MIDQSMNGIIPILVTPFFADGRIDEESLGRIVEFNIKSGVHGIGIANGSELYKFSERERDQVVRCVVEATAKRVPVVVSTGAAGTDLAIQYSTAARDAGADALMLMPPSFMPMTMEGVLEYYMKIASKVDLPLILQDVPTAPISPVLARQIAKDCESVKYIKVETFPLTVKVEAMVRAASDVLTIFGGAAGTYFIEEMRRGTRGTMPYCSQPDIFVRVWDMFQSGDEAGARELFDQRIMAINRMTAQNHDTQVRIHKRMLLRQGIIRCDFVRGPTKPLDPTTQAEADQLIADCFPEPGHFSS